MPRPALGPRACAACTRPTEAKANGTPGHMFLSPALYCTTCRSTEPPPKEEDDETDFRPAA